MNMDQMILVSVDDHIIEPPNVFEGRISAKYRDDAPRVVTYENGEQRWVVDGKVIPGLASAAVSGRKREELGAEASRFSEIRKALYDVNARVDDMNANGTLSSLCFPSMPGFAGQVFLQAKDKGLSLAMIKAYNDWHIEDWCGPHPGRFIPLAIVPLWDPALAVEEIRRVAALGFRSICLPENPSAFGLPSIHRNYWAPVLEACVENDLIVSIHIGTSGTSTAPSPDSPIDWINSMINVEVAGTLVDWTFSPMTRQFPTLKFALSEGCVGWVPFMMERADSAYKNHRFWTKQDLGDLMPSDIMRRQFLFCFHEDEFGLKNRHDLGVDLISWECDYPHADSTWPKSPENLWAQIKDYPDDEIDKITHANALRFFNFDPFKHVPREQATVRALRELAKDVDVSEQSLGGGRAPELDPELKVLTVGQLRKLQDALSSGLETLS